EQASRFDAELDAAGRYKPGKVFRDPAGRFIEYGQSSVPGPIAIPSRGAIIGAILLNIGGVLIWFVALWPILRFDSGHAAGMALVLGGVTILLLMPLLFNRNSPRAVNVAAPAAQRGMADSAV
ncbi:MAG: hypothetical protein ACRCZF_00765, partial [Gemmataceae bacterium]